MEWTSFANVGILDASTKAFEQAAWRSASKHFIGRGLGSGVPNLEPARSARRWLLKRERRKEVKASDCVVCGGIWDDFRMQGTQTCSERSASEVGAYHRYWSCPGLATHPDEAVRSTHWMRKLFDSRYQHLDCFWGRAIPPAALTQVPAEGTAEDIPTSTFFHTRVPRGSESAGGGFHRWFRWPSVGAGWS